MNKEYKCAVAKLTKENRKTIRKMQYYLETRYLNEIVFEGIMSDLVGMALECQERGNAFSESIGMDYKQFCRELAGNAKKQSGIERVFDVAQWLLIFDGIIVPLLYICYAIFGNTKPELRDFVLTAPARQLFMYFATATVLIIGWFAVRRLTYYSQTIVLGTYIIAVILTFLLTDFLGGMWFDGVMVNMNVAIWMIVIALLVAVFYLAKRVTAFTIAYHDNRK